jgi:two-component system invasion response regulator UvrY
MRVLVVDDHEFTREGVVRILMDNFTITKIASVGTYDEAMDQIVNNQWDIAILDINLKGKGGLEILKSIKASKIKIPVLVLSMVPVSQYTRRIVQAGACGYLTKSEPAEELLKAVRMVSRGRRYFSPDVQQELPDLIDEAVERPKHHDLSDREIEILQRLAEGKSPKEIARAYSLSVNSINAYRNRVLSKLKLKTNYDLIKYAYKNKMIE